MLSIIGYFIRYSLFAVIVLVLGQVLEFQGKTVSDQVKGFMRTAGKEDFIHQARKRADELVNSAASATHRGFGSGLKDDDVPSRGEGDRAKKLSSQIEKIREIKAQEKAALNQLLEEK